jgi:hypothetical protein
MASSEVLPGTVKESGSYTLLIDTMFTSGDASSTILKLEKLTGIRYRFF